MAEHQLPKLNTGVRFPSPAPKTASIKGYLPFLTFSHFTLVSLFFRLPVVLFVIASLVKGGGLPQASRRDFAELYGI